MCKVNLLYTCLFNYQVMVIREHCHAVRRQLLGNGCGHVTRTSWLLLPKALAIINLEPQPFSFHLRCSRLIQSMPFGYNKVPESMNKISFMRSVSIIHLKHSDKCWAIRLSLTQQHELWPQCEVQPGVLSQGTLKLNYSLEKNILYCFRKQHYVVLVALTKISTALTASVLH